ncbi:unnamed protein product [Heligmosomoides polygyrus]|uniref:CCHC-type domain-containing protein n=1 Tax=Heligmosomoides polygyrus TaxID=6339 RepID=A0A183FPT0_HELPZ|nr:unnamed protein product [Heligmosomoides polygyrus]
MLEKLSRAAYPELSERGLSTMRTGKLITKLTSWPEYVQLFTEVEQTSTHQSYEKLKSLAQRVERSHQVAEALKQEFEDKQRRPNHQWKRSTERRSVPGAQARSKKQPGQQETEKDRRNTTGKREVVCYNCKKTGHLRNKEQAPKTTGIPPTPDEREKRQGKQRGFEAKLGTWSCDVSKTGAGSSELTGPQIVAEVELLGQKKKALLDMGSQVSSISLPLLLKAAHAGFDLDNDVEEILTAEEAPIFNASGKCVPFKEAAHPALTLGKEGNPTIRAALFVMKDSKTYWFWARTFSTNKATP